MICQCHASLFFLKFTVYRFLFKFGVVWLFIFAGFSRSSDISTNISFFNPFWTASEFSRFMYFFMRFSIVPFLVFAYLGSPPRTPPPDRREKKISPPATVLAICIAPSQPWAAPQHVPRGGGAGGRGGSSPRTLRRGPHHVPASRITCRGAPSTPSCSCMVLYCVAKPLAGGARGSTCSAETSAVQAARRCSQGHLLATRVVRPYRPKTNVPM